MPFDLSHGSEVHRSVLGCFVRALSALGVVQRVEPIACLAYCSGAFLQSSLPTQMFTCSSTGSGVGAVRKV